MQEKYLMKANKRNERKFNNCKLNDIYKKKLPMKWATTLSYLLTSKSFVDRALVCQPTGPGSIPGMSCSESEIQGGTWYAMHIKYCRICYNLCFSCFDQDPFLFSIIIRRTVKKLLLFFVYFSGWLLFS